ncbi:409_t:CDS:1 [Paraglomus brasilianum]|uniref:409_t:CDS:1 n=1 Tax=Paraglomus brasilianum TaxID=144538 RepID=A0A9N8YV55_9GLOM|nr:409_t:CDS:1 [Paraglomus brasilianum]
MDLCDVITFPDFISFKYNDILYKIENGKLFYDVDGCWVPDLYEKPLSVFNSFILANGWQLSSTTAHISSSSSSTSHDNHQTLGHRVVGRENYFRSISHGGVGGSGAVIKRTIDKADDILTAIRSNAINDEPPPTLYRLFSKTFEDNENAFRVLQANLEKIGKRFKKGSKAEEVFERNLAWINVGYAYNYLSRHQKKTSVYWNRFKDVKDIDTVRKTAKSGQRILNVGDLVGFSIVLRTKISIKQIAEIRDDDWNDYLNCWKQHFINRY